MEQQSGPKTRRISRDDLYAQVWQTPMARLGQEFGVSGNGLAKICQRMHVPYPPRGYWAKKEAGKAVAIAQLAPLPPGVASEVEIHPTPPAIEEPADVQAVVAAAKSSAGAITVPETTDNLHPKVKAWLTQHKNEQMERAREHKRQRHDEWFFGKSLLPDLTERDLYRFKVTSAIFKAVEAAGGRIDSAAINGKVTFLIAGEKVECSIVEKMRQSLLVPREEGTKWTAYPEYHQNGLTSSGFLRVTITTYLPVGTKEWVETATKKIAALLPEIVGRIMAAGPILIERKREREESARKHREEEERRNERLRLKQIDDRRWGEFRTLAGNWHERAALADFLAEIETRFSVDADSTIAGQKLSEWIAWAQQKIDMLDPFKDGIGGLFEKISNRAGSGYTI